MQNKLTSEFVKEILHYDKTTGIFTWKSRANASKTWNTRYSSKTAGRLRGDGYWELIINKRYYLASRIAWLYMTGIWPSEQIDHIDRDRSNNSFYNLREATSCQNQCNKGKPVCNSTGYKGVTKNKYDRFVARIKIEKFHKHFGTFSTAEDAYKAYCQATTQYHGEFARLA